MKFNRCEICNEFHWENEKCADIYLAFNEDYTGDDGCEIRANSYESAAEKMAIRVNSECDYMNEEIQIEIEKLGSGIRKKFIVVPEPSIYYNIDETK